MNLNNRESEIEIIHRYIDESLTMDEKLKFEDDLKQNKALYDLYCFEKTLIMGIKNANSNSLKDRIIEVENEFFKSHKSKLLIMKNFRIVAVAASLILVFGLFYFLKPKAEFNPDNAISAFYKPESDRADKIIGSFDQAGFANPYSSNDTFKLAMKLYKEMKYKDALKEFHAYLQAFPNDKVAQLYFGISHFNASNYSEAITVLNPLANDDAFEQKEDAIWNLAFCLMKAENSEKTALAYFNKLAQNPSSPHKKNAEGVIDLIKK